MLPIASWPTQRCMSSLNTEIAGAAEVAAGAAAKARRQQNQPQSG